MNHYNLPGVSRDADIETIRSAFRALARRFHPDAGEGSSPQKFSEVVGVFLSLGAATQSRFIPTCGVR